MEKAEKKWPNDISFIAVKFKVDDFIFQQNKP